MSWIQATMVAEEEEHEEHETIEVGAPWHTLSSIACNAVLWLDRHFVLPSGSEMPI
jgi:hypothetical protein